MTLDSSVPYARLAAEVLALYVPPLRSPQTYRAIRQVLAEIAALPGVETTADITPAAIAAWLAAHPGRSPARSASLLRSFGPALRYAVARGYLRANPLEFRSAARWASASAIPRIRARRHLSADEVRRILDRADREAEGGDWEAGRLQALVYLYAYLGLRKSEALWLRIADVDLAARTVTIQSKPDWRPKTAASVAVLPAAAPLVEVLRCWIPRTDCEWVIPGRRSRRPWTGGMPGAKALDCLKLLAVRAGVTSPVTILGLRKTVATLARGWGLGQLELRALLRHSSVLTQEWYIEDDLEELRRATDRIRY